MYRSGIIPLLLLAMLAPHASRPALASGGDDRQPTPRLHLSAATLPIPPQPASRMTWRDVVTQAPDPARPARPHWVRRHPALFGALVGAGAGAVFGLLSENELICSGGDEDCFFYGAKRPLVGAGLGAGAGSLIGFALGR